MYSHNVVMDLNIDIINSIRINTFNLKFQNSLFPEIKSMNS